MMLKCIAVDDEQLALDLLVDNVSQVPFLQLVGTARNAMEVLRLLQETPVDLVFLDIQMPGLSGMQLAASLKGKTGVIFLTAYDHYALESYNVHAIDYLVKPVPFDRFLEACMKALDLFKTRAATPGTIAGAAGTAGSGAGAGAGGGSMGGADDPRYLFVNVEYNIVKIAVDDVLMIEGYKDYVKIHLHSTKRPVITRMSMKHLEEKLAPFDFLRVHKSYIVSLQRVESIHKSFVKIGELEIPVSEHYKEMLMDRVNRNNIL
ncbi:LytR/AlgR family response regulator transcription factor [Flavihumibacter petaseus]|uniref:Putative two-component response regulator n=1 Tax=Flavihumibacter petaseus NBRC 106054 TaxID=1220578 RepID=A0A0E9N395_9BACT|nr:LytTR family DNA-binding domain-containing protein [Flavihumibacter petaseus]GAO44141.1 putative two-component response regulator [Flavihumibacter petaseus NBRC 106054]